MPLFGHDKPKMEAEPVDDRWRRVDWDGVEGYAQPVQGSKNTWDFMVIMPEEADQGSVALTEYQHQEGFERTHVVSYRVKDALVWRKISVYGLTPTGSHSIRNFGAVMGSDLEKVERFDKISKDLPQKLE